MTDPAAPDQSRARRLWDSEPIAVLGAVQAALICATTFGLQLTAQQTGAVLTLAASILTLVARRKVTVTDLEPAA
jgi:hypothetical protein